MRVDLGSLAWPMGVLRGRAVADLLGNWEELSRVREGLTELANGS